jgi:hypothetical protein
MAATIFAKPLYVGLSNNLVRRYSEHVSPASQFHARLVAFSSELNCELSPGQLLFVCIPLGVSGQPSDEYTEPQIRLLEELLKTLCQPAFGDL